mmetsp:Transcript_37236/g.61684  ORF Transcript_37236/g.61684 Transcript_37236/m.61684 type:complete len:94 (+) Transcript_37236:256-537(+)
MRWREISKIVSSFNLAVIPATVCRFGSKLKLDDLRVAGSPWFDCSRCQKCQLLNRFSTSESSSDFNQLSALFTGNDKLEDCSSLSHSISEKTC